MHARTLLAALLLATSLTPLSAQTRLLRQPTVAGARLVFAYGGDLWLTGLAGGAATRLTATPAVESDPQLSPDGATLAFTSNRDGVPAVYVMPVEGGELKRLTWYPSAAYARGWTPDGQRVLYASARETAPTEYDRLWTVSRDGGPSELVPAPWGTRGAYSPDGARLVVDRVDRWDVEFRNYRGGQNTALTLLDLDDLDETLLPNERTTDVAPVWLGGTVYFISDRDRAANVWAYDVASGNARQLTRFRNADVKSLTGHGTTLVLEQDGYLHVLELPDGQPRRLDITVRGDFPWASARWLDVARGNIGTAALSPTGKRAVMEARGEVFTVPVEKGDARNLTRSSDAADRAPVWSPDGTKVAWFSDDGSGYVLKIGAQDGTGTPRTLPLGESKYAWTPAWSPDGKYLAFADDRARVRVVELASGDVRTADTGGDARDRGGMGLTWSPDSKWLAYSKTFPNRLSRIVTWSVADGQVRPLTDALAHARTPAFDRDGRHLYFLGSTDVGLASGWANTSAMNARPTFSPYVVVLRAEDPTPFPPESDEEASSPPRPDTSSAVTVRIDFEGIDQRTLALPGWSARPYGTVVAGPKGTVFIGESVANQPGETLHKYTLAQRKAEEYATGVQRVSASADGKKLLYQSGPNWQVADAASKPDPSKGRLNVTLRARIDPAAEWQQIFEGAWHYQRDLFYDPGTHGADWDAVRRRYEPLVAHLRHRADLNYVLDMVNGELSVGHSFVNGGDLPAVDTARVGLLGADLEAHEGRWRIRRIYGTESWNPTLAAPLTAPGLQVRAGQYLVAVDGVELNASDDPYRIMDGTRARQTVLSINDRPSLEGARTITVVPVANETGLRRAAWIEDNRRRVDELSGGKLAYVWVPNTGGDGTSSFNRYYFSQQDKQGAVIDERYNQGGLLDDYMVDVMGRTMRAAITNEAPGGRPLVLPAGVLGPKVLLINEQAGSGGDFFPWIFRHQQIGPLIGTRTWGGLVASCSHYPMVDGGSVTAPCNAVFQPGVGWIAENEGVAPDVEVRLDAKSVAAGRDPQLERGVQEALRLLSAQGERAVVPPPFPRPAGWPTDQ